MLLKEKSGFTSYICYLVGLLRWLSGKESPCTAGDTGDAGSFSGSGRSHVERNPTPVLWPGESHGQRSLVGYVQLALE